jgi:hypothetical protein
MQIKSETVNVYKGFQYVIPKRLASHQGPYVKVRWQNQGVAYILLRTQVVEFYDLTPAEVRNQIEILKTWIKKNLNLCKKVWNKHNEVKV